MVHQLRVLASAYGHVLTALAAPFEILLLAWIAYRLVRRSRRPSSVTPDFRDRVREAVFGVLGHGFFAELLAAEISTLYYGLFSFFRPAPLSPTAFTIHRRGGYAAMLFALALACVVEMSVLDLLLRRASPLAANILLALGAYGIVWIIADYQALRLRPLLVEDGTLRVRVGLRKEISIPLVNVASLVAVPFEGEPKSDYARCTVFGRPELLLTLKAPSLVEQLFRGTRPVSCIGLRVDDEVPFRQLLARSL